MQSRELLLFVEGKGDETAVPTIAKRVLKELGGNDALHVVQKPFRVGNLRDLVTRNGEEWRRYLRSAGKTNPAAILLVLDGDCDRIPGSWKAYIDRFGTQFCAARAAGILVDQAKHERAGNAFSVGVVFIMKEFEAWLLAGIESLRGKPLPVNRGVVPMTATLTLADVEAKRGAKQVLRKQIPGYKESLDQGILAEAVDLAPIRSRCRSFRRFESAIQKLVDAARTGTPVVSPTI